MRRRFRASAFLTVPLIVIAMGDLIPGTGVAIESAGITLVKGMVCRSFVTTER